MEVLGLLFCFSRNQYSRDNKKIYKINIYREKGTETERICNALESDITFISPREVKTQNLHVEIPERSYRLVWREMTSKHLGYCCLCL